MNLGVLCNLLLHGCCGRPLLAVFSKGVGMSVAYVVQVFVKRAGKLGNVVERQR